MTRAVGAGLGTRRRRVVRSGRRLARTFFRRPTLDVARDLLGLVLVHAAPAGTTAGAIVEVEAYIGEGDPACHAAAGPTARNAPMYGDAGHAYVYLNYGIHYLFNVVTEPAGCPAAVLVRALAPLDGLDLMRQRRRGGGLGKVVVDHDLCRGPGNLTKALGIGPGENRADLTARDGRLWIEDRGLRMAGAVWTARVGIRVGLDSPWRALVPGHPSVSRLPGSGRI